MVRAFVHWSKMERVSSPDGWLFCVGRNYLNSYFRRRRLAMRSRLPEPGDEEAGASIDRIWLRDFVQSLPSKQRVVLILRFFLDLSVAQTSDVLGWPEGTVKTLTRQGVARLREKVASEV
jgi:RNA polymerase sigma factor (sigma-70 family)